MKDNKDQMACRNRSTILKVIGATVGFVVLYLLIQNGFTPFKSTTFQVIIRPDIYLERNCSGRDPNCLKTIQRFVKEDGDIAITIPRQSELQKLHKEEVSCLYHRYLNTLQQHCSLLTRIGNLKQGGWTLCMDGRYKPNKNSLVFSFSYGTDYSKYAKILADKYQSEVHSYAPNILEQRLKSGIFTHQTDPNKQRSLQTSIEKSDHSKQKDFEILTLDMANNAIQFLREAINTNVFNSVKQISFILQRTNDESSKQDYITILETLRDLCEAGFRIVWMEQSEHCVYLHHPKRTGCHTITMVRKPTDIGIKEQTQYLIPSSISSLPKKEIGIMYHRYLTRLQYFCKQIVRMGRLPDGGWDVCHDTKYRPSKNCLVYSFGIDDDFSFDDDIAKQYGCEVHSFDPSLNLEEHKHSDKVYFHPVGLSDSKREKMGNRGGYWQLDTLFNIRKELGHDKRRIDVLKLDIESSEWAAIPSMIKSGVLSDVVQFSLELHTYTARDTDTIYIQRLKLLKSLYDFGFRIFWFHTNVHCRYYASDTGNEWSNCNEIDMVNINALSNS